MNSSAAGPGARFGSYELVGVLGQGGMGAVYRARDSKLGRDVAIKVLLPEVAGDPERLARFQYEAKTLAALNHPNIAQIYGLEAGPAGPFLVLEFVDGPTLADRIGEGAIPVDEALPIARQIADALEAAHDQGIVHRDLKPANIKVRPDGTVKVLDFGLAKALEPATGSSTVLTNSPTLTTPAMTAAGVLLGTAAYMSPEQIKGHAADRRSDIWAFGCVLFEMLTGRPAFSGQSVAELLASVIRDEPRSDRLSEALHPAVSRLLRRCLAKEPRQRFPHAGAVRLELDDALSMPADIARLTPPKRSVPVWLPWMIVAALGAVAARGLLRTPLPDTPSASVSRLSIPIGSAPSSTLGRLLTISPDGRCIVYVSDGQLFRRYIDELVSQPIAGTVGSPMSPIFSPDGRWVAYQEGSPRTLKKVPVEGGTPVVVKSGLQGSVATVSWDGNGILLEDGGLLRVVPDGSQRGERISLPVPEGRRIRHPIASGDALLFNVDEVGTQTIGFARKGVATNSLAPGYDPRLLPTGHLLWARNGVLMAAGFDVLRGALTTAPAEVVRGVAQAPSGLVPTSYHAVSDNGTLVYIPGVSPDEPKALVARDREGHDRALDAPPRTYLVPRLSPDGTRIALSIDDAGEDIWIWDIRRRALQQVTSGDDVDTYAIWTPDGNSIVYSSTRGARRRLFMRRADGAGEPRLLLDETDTVFANAITRDGRELIYSGGQHGVRAMPLSGGPSRQVTGPLGARSAALSPDDRFIAYQSSESGVSQVYVRPYPDAQRARWQVSTTGGTRPAWSHSGRELFYVNERNQMVSVLVEVRAGELVAGEPKVLFDASDALSAAYRNFDVGLDDQTFILPKGAPVLPSNQIVVVQHWFDELRRLVPLPPH